MGDWITLQWYASADEAAADVAALVAAGVRHDLIDDTLALCRPNGTIATLQLRVHPADEPEAIAALAMDPDPATAEIAATDIGDGPLEFLELGQPLDRYVPAKRFDSAAELLRESARLEAAGVQVSLPRLVPADSPLASPRREAGRFVLLVSEGHLSDAFQLLAREDRPPGESVLRYAQPDAGDWQSLQWFGSEAEAQTDIDVLKAAEVEYELAALPQSLRRPDGTIARLQLRVPAEQMNLACSLLKLWPAYELDSAEIAATNVGSAPMELLQDGAVVQRWLPMMSFDSALDLIDHAAVLSHAQISVMSPRLVHRDSPLASAGRCQGRFILFVDERQIDQARQAILDDAVPQDEDEPRCPRCRSWCVSECRVPAPWVFRMFAPRDPSRCECGNCGYVDRRPRFFRHLVAPFIGLATVVKPPEASDV